MEPSDQETSDNSQLPESLESATDQLKSSIERGVEEILGVAEARAAEIEQEATAAAMERERAASRRAQEILNGAAEGVLQMGQSVAGLETAVGNAVTALRGEIEALSLRLKEDLEALPDHREEADLEVQPIFTQLPEAHDERGEGESSGEPDPRRATTMTAEFGDLLRAQITSMLEMGKSRAEAERYLMALDGAERYVYVIDEIYPDPGHELTAGTESSTPNTSPRRKRFRKGAG